MKTQTQTKPKAMNIQAQQELKSLKKQINADAIKVAKATVPTSTTMAGAIEARRKRLEGRAQPASATEAKAATPSRKIVK